MDMLFYTGSQFPAEYRNQAFVSLHGSWNRSEPSGYKIVRIRFENGQPREADDFISGFLLPDKKSHIARPCGMAQLPDGSLLLTDDGGGVIYRISYKGS
ncbi:PQQ-dependent sugar dehydrogenase [Cesiribacter andamanensis]|uniref:Pyrroloquinoline quinone-dependent pyranose dehydrogenase beta-propeller domain-containing protein n=1 Tax=Cesiribacter andamanensis AMV16 TaxID=1279009 RepID=M7N0J9_9BACT|nr:hypothetical protein [Cesiribacter andamanensis]EMR02218.1 hypothetical protein ADICEAN_02657 [Cesiribacter andamanensis AMV16]